MKEYIVFDTVLGWVGLAADSKGLIGATLPQPDESAAVKILWAKTGNGLLPCTGGLLHQVCEALKGYLRGKPEPLDFPVNWSIFSPFQQRVLRAVRDIPYGQTQSYQWVARKAGHPGAGRAVGNVLGANRVPLIIPCHRVIRKDGSLGGFTGASPVMKKQLIEMEKLAGKF